MNKFAYFFYYDFYIDVGAETSKSFSPFSIVILTALTKAIWLCSLSLPISFGLFVYHELNSFANLTKYCVNKCVAYLSADFSITNGNSNNFVIRLLSLCLSYDIALKLFVSTLSFFN
nr:hypothetical protein [Mycoplasmopsis bovis]